MARRRELLGRIEDAGIDHVFVADHVSFFVGAGMDGLIQAATAAALAPKLRVVVGVYLLALRHPVPVARQIASLAEAAPGRLVLGVGVGGEDRHEVEICGVDPKTRGRRTNDCLRALRGLLQGEAFSLQGDFFEFEDALILPAPDPAVPIVIGGRSEAAVQRAAQYGDGWLGVWCSPRRFGDVVEQIDGLAAGLDRMPPVGATGEPGFEHGLQVWVGVDKDRARARTRLAKGMQDFYRTPYERFERYSPYGSAEEVADFLSGYVDAGCRFFNIMPVAGSAEAGIDAVAEIRERIGPMTRPAQP